MPMTAQEIKEAYPDIIAGFEQEARKRGYDEGYAKGKDEGLTTGAESERERIRAIDALDMPGHKDLMDELKYDGKTTQGEAAVKWAEAEKEARKTRAQARAEEAPPAVPQVGAGQDEENKKDFNTLVAAYQEENGCSRGEAIKAVVSANPEAHKAYLDSLTPKKKGE